MRAAVGVLIYYPFFPTYRKGILEALAARTDLSIEFAAGTRGRAGIKSLTASDLPFLQQLPTTRVGGASVNRGVLRLALQPRFDVVVVAPATVSFSVWGVLLVRRFLGRRTYLWGQCGKPGARGIKRIAQEVMNRLATGLLVYGESERRGATELGTKDEKVHVVNNAVEHFGTAATLNVEEFDTLSFARGIGNPQKLAEINVTYVGRLTYEKRVDALIEAIRLLRDDLPMVKAIVVGDGAASSELHKQVAADALPVVFHGAIHDSTRLSEVFREATVVVAPSEVGLLAVDSLQHGVPVLYGENPLHNGPEVEVLTLGVNAMTFTPGEPEAIARAIRDWFTAARNLDPRAYREATINSLGMWSPESVSAKIASAISDGTLSKSAPL